MRVLFLAANPMETTRLGLASEIRDVKAAVERGRLGKALDLCPELGVRINELQHLIDRDRPDIVHFKIAPKWLRYSNFNQPVLIEEMSVPF